MHPYKKSILVPNDAEASQVYRAVESFKKFEALTTWINQFCPYERENSLHVRTEQDCMHIFPTPSSMAPIFLVPLSDKITTERVSESELKVIIEENVFIVHDEPLRDYDLRTKKAS
jgi:hypothetical protein